MCDVDRLASLLESDPQAADAWATVMEVAPQDTTATASSYTPLLLARDTAVTNHTYRNGTAEGYQAVLQAGTPVLVDQSGTPRVKCSCGNPLLAPEPVPTSTSTTGREWDSYDEEAVIKITPSHDDLKALQTIEVSDGSTTSTAVGPIEVLEGLLVSTTEAVEVFNTSGAWTQVLDFPVEAAMDDGSGGLLYAKGRDDGAGYHPPAPSPEDAVIWHLPRGSSNAVPLLPDDGDPATWDVLVAAGELGGRQFAVIYRLRPTRVFEDSGGEGEEVAEGPAVLVDIASGDTVQLEEIGYGWETAASQFSFAGDRLAYEFGYSQSDWIILDENLQEVPNQCRMGSELNPEDATEDACGWTGALDDEGRLVSTVTSDPMVSSSSAEEIASIRALDLDTGKITALHEIDLDEQLEYWRIELDAWDGSVLISARRSDPEDRVETLAMVDLTTGEQTDLSLPGTARFLRAPLVRPTGSVEIAVEPEPATSTPPTTALPEVDLRNTTLPAGTCGQEYPAIPVSDGGGSAGELTDEGFIGAETDNDTIISDVDGDGTTELVAIIVCHWGGSGFETVIVAFDVAADSTLSLELPPLQHYDRSWRSAGSVSEHEVGVLRIDSYEAAPEDPLCCPSIPFEAFWAFRGDEWVEVSG